MTGGAFCDLAAYNETTGLFHYDDYLGAGVDACINGDCSLPGETDVVNAGCNSAVGVFTVDYDAPVSRGDTSVKQRLLPLVKKFKGKRGYKGLVKRGEAERKHE